MIYGRFHFTHYPVESVCVNIGEGCEVEDCESHRDVWEKAFRILSGPFIKGWRDLKEYEIRPVSSSRGLTDIIIKHSCFKMKIYNPKSGIHEGLICSDKAHWDLAMGNFFDQIGVNVCIEEGDLREVLNNGKVIRL